MEETQRFNRVTFPKQRFPSKTALWASVGALLQILDETENISVVWDDGECVNVDFNPTRDSLIECAKPYWLYDDEYEQLELNDCAADEDDDLYKE